MTPEQSSSNELTRRDFARTSAATALGLAASGLTRPKDARAQGANDRVRVGFIGVGNRGGQLLDAFLEHDDVEVTAFCDVYEPYLDRAREKTDASIPVFRDFRRMLDQVQMDAVAISTPDHWHAIQTIQACKAGLDVYVEKPLSITVHEGRKMVEAANEYDRVVQVGTHRRSSPLYHRMAKLVRDGRIGKVTVGRCYRLSNMYPDGIGHEPLSNPPENLDWDMWLGPRPYRPYQDNIAPYKFRWWKQYSSQMANWGVHFLDAIRWLTDEQAPASICAMGGQFAVDDDRTVPDTLEAAFQFRSGRLAIFGQYEASGFPAMRQGEIELRGTQGTLLADANSFRVVPERGGQFESSDPRMEEIEGEEEFGSNAELTALHARNFLDCVKSREKPNADLETGHRSTSFSLLANISLAVGERLEWDADAERILRPAKANDLLHYEYRTPWTLG